MEDTPVTTTTWECGSEHTQIAARLHELEKRVTELERGPGRIVSLVDCTCSYAWGGSGEIVRNGPRADCPYHGTKEASSGEGCGCDR